MHRREFLGRAALAPLAVGADGAPRTNLLFLMADQFRFDALSAMGSRIVSTPHLDRLAREGALFRNAMSACPVCVPARTAMLTGKTLANTKVVNNRASRDTELDCGPSFDNLLHAQGYQTEYYGKWHAPYRMARTYDNKVCPVGTRVEGVLTEKQNYLRYLDRHVPRRNPKPGERIDPGSERPYTPAILDSRAEGDAGDDDEARQANVYGFLHIPKEYSRAAHTVDEALGALEKMKGGAFSLTCSIGPPHPPMVNVAPYWGMYPADSLPLPKNFQHDMSDSPYRQMAARMEVYHKPENIRAMTSIYYGMVKEVDDNIGRLLGKLDEFGVARNTLVIFTADHGEMLGAHGMRGKGCFYEEAVHIPLLLRLPAAVRAGTVVETPVSQADLFPTILDYLGVRAPEVDGRSLRPVIEGRAGYPDFAVSEWNPVSPNFMVRTRGGKLMLANRAAARTRDALFDLGQDPYEMRNLLGAAEGAAARRRAGEMRDRLVSWCERVRSPYLDEVKRRPL